MNIYAMDQLAREETRRVLAEAAVARRVREARNVQRADAHVAVVAAHTGPEAHPRSAFGRLVARPYTAFQAWISAGLL